MIISHKHKFIFIAIPKTGTHSIRFALRGILGKNDEEQVGLFKRSTLNNDKLASIRHGHITAIQAKQELDSKVWDTYYKFTFIRDPFERFLSYSFFFFGNDPLMQKYPVLQLKKLILKPYKQKYAWYRPQSDYVLDNKGQIIVDHIGTTENNQKDFNNICQQIGIKTTKLAKVNQSNQQHNYAQYYDKELIKLVNEYYYEDFKLYESLGI